MKVKVSSFCDIGKARARNQDSILVYRDEVCDFALFAVADGMGGHQNGEKASRAITTKLKTWLSQTDISEFSKNAPALLKALRDQIVEINNYIWETWNQQQVCGSTCALLFVLGSAYGVFSVGDSRIYLSRGMRCVPITKDDVWENQKQVMEQYRKEELVRHPDYGKLVHAVGSEKHLAYSMKAEALQPGDVFALCSDGVYKMCGSSYLKRKICSCRWRNPETVKEDIIRKVFHSGAKDNVSLILVKCQ